MTRRSEVLLKPRSCRNCWVNFGGALAAWIAVRIPSRFFCEVRYAVGSDMVRELLRFPTRVETSPFQGRRRAEDGYPGESHRPVRPGRGQGKLEGRPPSERDSYEI